MLGFVTEFEAVGLGGCVRVRERVLVEEGLERVGERDRERWRSVRRGGGSSAKLSDEPRSTTGDLHIIPRRDRCLSRLVLRLLSLLSRSSVLSPFLCLPPSLSRDLLLLLRPSLSLSFSRSRERLLSRRFSFLSLDRER